MKTNKFMRIASVLLVAVVLTTCAISGTFAKYTSSTTANDSATVAKWSITVDGKDIQTQKDAVTFDLFNTIKDTAGATEDDVVAGKIAPGTSGSFDLKVKNASEVTAKYTITFTATANNIPLEFKLSTDADTAWTTDLSSISISSGNVAVGTEEATHTVEWRWVFENNRDEADTNLGVTPVDYLVSATIVAEQVD